MTYCIEFTLPATAHMWKKVEFTSLSKLAFSDKLVYQNGTISVQSIALCDSWRQTFIDMLRTDTTKNIEPSVIFTIKSA
jgi:hypothetical protein